MEEITINLDPDRFPHLCRRDPERVKSDLIKLAEFHKVELTKKTAASLLCLLESDLADIFGDR